MKKRMRVGAVLWCEGDCKKPTPHTYKKQLRHAFSSLMSNPHGYEQLWACLHCHGARRWGYTTKALPFPGKVVDAPRAL